MAAPVDGRVIGREVTLGESVGPEREALAVLANMEALWVVADVPEGRIAQVRLEAPATVRLGGTNGEPIEGTIGYIAPQVNPATRTVSVRIEVPGDSPALRPGMFAEVEFGRPGDSAAGEAVLEIG